MGVEPELPPRSVKVLSVRPELVMKFRSHRMCYVTNHVKPSIRILIKLISLVKHHISSSGYDVAVKKVMLDFLAQI